MLLITAARSLSRHRPIQKNLLMLGGHDPNLAKPDGYFLPVMCPEIQPDTSNDHSTIIRAGWPHRSVIERCAYTGAGASLGGGAL